MIWYIMMLELEIEKTANNFFVQGPNKMTLTHLSSLFVVMKRNELHFSLLTSPRYKLFVISHDNAEPKTIFKTTFN